MISYYSSSCTTKRKRDSGVGSLTRLIARYKAHNLSLLLYQKYREMLSSWQYREMLSSWQFDQPHS
jgi:hypothetical protein